VTDVPTTPRRAMSQTRRLRIWEAAKGICILCEQKIDGVREAWIVEHKIALGLGGEDTDDNCGPAHEDCRRAKDKIDVPAIARAKRRKAKHLGIKKRKSFQKPPGVRFDWSQGRYVKEAT
jgi:5-methylcytosine-specific restriction enzyme A